MSSRYLLPCPDCKKQVPVESGNAGGTVICACGKTVDVPRMGILRTFPQEASASVGPGPGASGGHSNWGFRQGLMFLGAVLLVAGGVPALYKAITFPNPRYPTQEQMKDIADDFFEKKTLTESWIYWKTIIEPYGLSHQPTREEAAYEKMAADLRQVIMIFGVVAGIGAILLVVGFFVPGSNPNRM